MVNAAEMDINSEFFLGRASSCVINNYLFFVNFYEQPVNNTNIAFTLHARTELNRLQISDSMKTTELSYN